MLLEYPVKELINVKQIFIFLLCIVSVVGCQRKSATLSQESMEITEVRTNTDRVTNANADVNFVRAEQANDGSWTFYVTVQHPDTGWEDYADGWDIVTPDGQVLKPNPTDKFTRTLLHPHVDEQPFVRSQSGSVVPEGLSNVYVRAHDLVDGFGGKEVAVDLTVESGPGFEVHITKE